MNESKPNGPLARFLEPRQGHGPSVANVASQLQPLMPYIAGCALVALGLVAVAFVLRTRARARMNSSWWSLEVSLPQTVDEHSAEVFWTNTHDLLRPRWKRLWEGQPHLAFEYVWNPNLYIRVSAPDILSRSIVRRAIEAAWPGALTSDLDDEIGSDFTSASGGELRLSAPEWFPIETKHASDPIRTLIGAVGTISEREYAAVQVLARPATAGRSSRCTRAAKLIANGRSVGLVHAVLDFLQPRSSNAADHDPNKNSDVQYARQKGSSLGWECVIRYVVASSGNGAQNASLKLRAHGVASAFAVFTGRNRFQRKRMRSPLVSVYTRSMGRGDLLSARELAAIAHLPFDEVVPGVVRAGARSVPPAPAVASEGKVIGDSQGISSRPVAIEASDARYHLHVLGATGSGKSTLLTNLVLQDLEAGRGAVVIDPKGDLIDDILERLPGADVVGDKVVLLDSRETEKLPALNMLEADNNDLAVDHVVGIFRNIFEAYWGPRTDDILRSACLTLLRKKGATLADVPRLLTDVEYRSEYTTGLSDPYGLGGFWNWYDSMTEAQQNQVIGPVMNKLRAFLLRPFIRNTVGASKSKFKMATVLDGGLLLARLPKGELGDETTRLLGSFIVAKVWQAATARATLSSGNRKDAALYVDECQNFLNLPRSFDEILAEARGYGLSLVLAHQHLGQLSRELRDAISANARNKVILSCSPEDARVLERHTLPELNAHDLSHLGAYQAALRVVNDGREQPACTVIMRPSRTASAERGIEARNVARDAWGEKVARADRPQSRETPPSPAVMTTQNEYSQRDSQSPSHRDSQRDSHVEVGVSDKCNDARQTCIATPTKESDLKGETK